MFLNEYTNTAIDISIICESKALEVFYLKSLVSPATIVTVIGIRELLVRIVTQLVEKYQGCENQVMFYCGYWWNLQKQFL